MNLLGKLRAFFSYLLSYASDFSEYQKIGLKAHTYNSDFMLVKKFAAQAIEMRVLLGLEPHHPQLGPLMDFEVPDACLILKGASSNEALKHALGEHFEVVKVRGDYIFAFSKHLQLDDIKMKLAVSEINALIEQGSLK